MKLYDNDARARAEWTELKQQPPKGDGLVAFNINNLPAFAQKQLIARSLSVNELRLMDFCTLQSGGGGGVLIDLQGLRAVKDAADVLVDTVLTDGLPARVSTIIPIGSFPTAMRQYLIVKN